jgi:hypothetical protein
MALTHDGKHHKTCKNDNKKNKLVNVLRKMYSKNVFFFFFRHKYFKIYNHTKLFLTSIS